MEPFDFDEYIKQYKQGGGETPEPEKEYEAIYREQDHLIKHCKELEHTIKVLQFAGPGSLNDDLIDMVVQKRRFKERRQAIFAITEEMEKDLKGFGEFNEPFKVSKFIHFSPSDIRIIGVRRHFDNQDLQIKFESKEFAIVGEGDILPVIHPTFFVRRGEEPKIESIPWPLRKWGADLKADLKSAAVNPDAPLSFLGVDFAAVDGGGLRCRCVVDEDELITVARDTEGPEVTLKSITESIEIMRSRWPGVSVEAIPIPGGLFFRNILA